MAPAPVVSAALSAPPLSGLTDLPVELWLLTAQYLQPADQAAFFESYPHGMLADEAAGSAAVASIRQSHRISVVREVLARAHALAAPQRAQMLVHAAGWICGQLRRFVYGPGEPPLHALLGTCLDHADTLPYALKNRFLSLLPTLLSQLHGPRYALVRNPHGAFATRLIEALLAAARGGDRWVCRAVAGAPPGVARLIDLEHCIAPGAEHEDRRAARTAAFMAVQVGRGAAGSNARLPAP